MRPRIEPLPDPVLDDFLRQAETVVLESRSSVAEGAACVPHLAEISRKIFQRALFIYGLPEGQIRQVQTMLEKIDTAIIPCDDPYVMGLKEGMRGIQQDFMENLHNP